MTAAMSAKGKSYCVSFTLKAIKTAERRGLHTQNFNFPIARTQSSPTISMYREFLTKCVKLANETSYKAGICKLHVACSHRALTMVGKSEAGKKLKEGVWFWRAPI